MEPVQEMPNPFVIVAVFAATLLVVRLFTTLIHELGHGFFGLLLLKGNFDIYIGSYGDPDRGMHFKIGRIKLHIVYAPFSTEKGVFRPESQNTTPLKDFLVTLGGPLASLTTGALYLYLALTMPLPEIMKMSFYILTGSSLLDFWYNIKPGTDSVTLHDGSFVYNDGYMLKYRWEQMFKKEE
ncbi:MAG: hypothetical protein V4580_08910 [Bacteroidota bacterium]